MDNTNRRAGASTAARWLGSSVSHYSCAALADGSPTSSTAACHSLAPGGYLYFRFSSTGISSVPIYVLANVFTFSVKCCLRPLLKLSRSFVSPYTTISLGTIFAGDEDNRQSNRIKRSANRKPRPTGSTAIRPILTVGSTSRYLANSALPFMFMADGNFVAH